MSKIQCYRCHKYGHFKSQCPKGLNDRKRKGEKHATTTKIDEHLKNLRMKIQVTKISSIFLLLQVLLQIAMVYG